MATHLPAAERLVQLETKRRQIDAQIATLSAREQAQQRKDDDRRRINGNGLALQILSGQSSDLSAYIVFEQSGFTLGSFGNLLALLRALGSPGGKARAPVRNGRIVSRTHFPDCAKTRRLIPSGR